jgi:hypothetical protein
MRRRPVQTDHLLHHAIRDPAVVAHTEDAHVSALCRRACKGVKGCRCPSSSRAPSVAAAITDVAQHGRCTAQPASARCACTIERRGCCTFTRAAEEDATLTANALAQGGLSTAIHSPLIPFAVPRWAGAGRLGWPA